jgi:hypothetical protein
MKFVVRCSLLMVFLVLFAGTIRWNYTQTSLYKVRVGATRICSAIGPGIDITQLEKLALEEGGSFVQVTSHFGLAAKSFCRCGVYLERRQTVSSEHPVWCLH